MACLLGFVFLTPNTLKHGIESDSRVYMQTALNIAEFGKVSRDPAGLRGGTPTTEMYLVPGYPTFLAGFMAASPEIEAQFKCALKQEQNCRNDAFSTIVFSQKIIWTVSLIFIFMACTIILKSQWLAVFCVLIVILGGETADNSRRIITESLCFSAIFAALYFLVAGIHGRRKIVLWGLAGACVGLAVLTRPSFQILLLLITVIVIFFAIRGSDRRPAARIALSLAPLLGGLLVLSPWLARNFILFDAVSVSEGYGSVILVQRLAYNAMNWNEWGAAFVYWLPDFGDTLATALLGPETVSRLSFGSPNGFYLAPDLQAAGLPTNITATTDAGTMIREGIFGNLTKHTLVTLPLVVRGARVGDYTFILALICFLPAIFIAIPEDRILTFLALALPPVFMLGLHAFVSVSIARYNGPLIIVYAIVIVAVATALFQRLRQKHK